MNSLARECPSLKFLFPSRPHRSWSMKGNTMKMSWRFVFSLASAGQQCQAPLRSDVLGSTTISTSGTTFLCSSAFRILISRTVVTDTFC